MSFGVDEARVLVEKIEAINSNPHAVSELQHDGMRRRLREAARRLSYAMEEPGDTINRLAHTVSDVPFLHHRSPPPPPPPPPLPATIITSLVSVFLFYNIHN